MYSLTHSTLIHLLAHLTHSRSMYLSLLTVYSSFNSCIHLWLRQSVTNSPWIRVFNFTLHILTWVYVLTHWLSLDSCTGSLTHPGSMYLTLLTIHSPLTHVLLTDSSLISSSIHVFDRWLMFSPSDSCIHPMTHVFTHSLILDWCTYPLTHLSCIHALILDLCM